MAPGALVDNHGSSDREFARLMHGKSAQEHNSLLSMLKKDNESHRALTDAYVGHWNDENGRAETTEEARDKRKGEYMSIVNNYYDLATDFYEEAWGQSFHFCRFAPGESFLQALARQEHYLAHRMNITDDMKVLDVGCGVGGPARQIATFTGCKVIGLNNNSYQIERGTSHAKKDGLQDQVSFVQGDFMKMSFEPNTFDAVYAIEATVHAPSLQGVYEQIYRVLKPGGIFGVYEWVMTDNYDDSVEEHRAVRLGIERGSGIPNMTTKSVAINAIQAAGFVLEHAEDLAARPDRVPWYSPLAGELQHVRSLWDLFSAIRLTKVGRGTMSYLLRLLEAIRLAPSGTSQTADELAGAADSLVSGGKQGIFTPMFMMIARKPNDGN